MGAETLPDTPPTSHEDWVLQAIDKLKAAGELLDAHGTDAADTAEGLALAAAEILARRAPQ